MTIAAASIAQLRAIKPVGTSHRWTSLRLRTSAAATADHNAATETTANPRSADSKTIDFNVGRDVHSIAQTSPGVRAM